MGKWRKPFGSKNSFVNRTIRNPGAAIVGASLLGSTGAALGAAVGDTARNATSKTDEYNKQVSDANNRELSAQDEFTRLGTEEERRRKELGIEQQGQINTFADQFAGKAKGYRNELAATLANQNLESFKLANPHILEDLNARGLFTSPTGVNQAQTDALKELELDRQSKLVDFDTNVFGQESDIRGNALSALIGGNQSALESALEMQRNKLQRSFDVADQESRRRTAEYLAKKQARNQLISSLISGGTQVGAAYLTSGRSLAARQPSYSTYGE